MSDWPIDYWFDCLASWLIDWLGVCLSKWLANWMAWWLLYWHWLVECLIERLSSCTFPNFLLSLHLFITLPEPCPSPHIVTCPPASLLISLTCLLPYLINLPHSFHLFTHLLTCFSTSMEQNGNRSGKDKTRKEDECSSLENIKVDYWSNKGEQD